MSLLPGFETVGAKDGERRPDEYYPTPGWCVEAVLPLLRYRTVSGPVLEPAIGHGSIATRLAAESWLVRERGASKPTRGARWWVSGCDISEALVDECQAAGLRARKADFLRESEAVASWSCEGLPSRWSWYRERPVAVVGNPPFSLALEFAEAALKVVEPEVGVVAFLMRDGFMHSQRRAAFWRANPCDVLYLDRRPSFTGAGTASDDYVWCLWPGSGLSGRGLIWREGEDPGVDGEGAP